ncbi:MAG: GNAT family N-acetyltransferase [Rhodospirillales bacterium]|nr:MAG: GNAT family N-acetyltransferase [Rhodospirillales bacterium]
MTDPSDLSPTSKSGTQGVGVTIDGPLGPAHAAVIAALHEQCFDDPWAPTAVARLLSMSGSFALIACVERFPAGFLLCQAVAGEAEILTLGVPPRHRRSGLGRALLRRGLALAAAQDARRMVLEVATDNAAARALYTTCGFTTVGQRRRYYNAAGGASTDALILACALVPQSGDG